MNYSVFDPFLNRDTWHTHHPIDGQIFYGCLDQVVREPDFSAEAMGDYFRSAKQLDRAHPLNQAVDSYVTRAWAVRNYLEATGQL
jgi:hypothetical protein